MQNKTRRSFISDVAITGLTVSLVGCEKEPQETQAMNPTDSADCTEDVCTVDTTKAETVKKPSALCTPASTLIFACSGAADTGEIADRAARQLTKQGKGKMFCLAGIGGNVEPLVNATRKASTLIAIDGCSTSCVKQCLTKAGFNEFHHMIVTDLGFEKGNSPATDQNINKLTNKAQELFEA